MNTELQPQQSEEIAELIKAHSKAVRNHIQAYTDAQMALVSVRELEQEIQALGGEFEEYEQQAGFEY
jgi:membrane peptidoglycan carboxypeptidase